MKRVVALVLGFVMLILSCTFVAVSDDEETEYIEFYLYDDYIVKNESEYNAKMLDYASQLFTRVYEEQLSSSNDVYFALIPDKHRIVNGVDDYKSFLKYMESSLHFAETIEIAQLLTLSDYYKTDPHWKQECVVDVAKTLCESMGTSVDAEFKTISIDAPYNGVYVEQSGLHTSSDVLNYLEWDGLDAVLLEGANAVYDVDKFYGDDPYDVFLSGNQSIVKIKNQTIENDKRLVIFRDSFGSSIAPIMSTAYSEIVLIDLRYIMSESLSEYVDFENADVLFLYSTLLLNNSMSMK